jgi:hypothetical protein
MAASNDGSSPDLPRPSTDGKQTKRRGLRRRSEERAAVVAALSECRTDLERTLIELRAKETRANALRSAQASVGRFATVTAEYMVPPERMIVMLKRSVNELPTVRELVMTERDTLSHELVQMAIEAYYSRSDP